MSDDRREFDPADQAALYAAGALSAEECAAFEARLAAGDAKCLAELKALDPVVAALAGGVAPVEPSPSVRERLMARIAGEGTGTPSSSPPAAGTEESAPSGERPAPKRGVPVDKAKLAEFFVQHAADARWRDAGIPGVKRRVLFIDRETRRYSVLLRCEAGSTFPAHVHEASEETLVLEGDVQLGDLELGPGDYLRAPAGSEHAPQTTRRGCLILVTGTLSATGAF